MTKNCLNCGADIEFNVGITSAVGNQPSRAHADCPKCGTSHYFIPENGTLAIDKSRPQDRGDAETP